MIVSVVFLFLAAIFFTAWLTFDKWPTKWAGGVGSKKPINNEGRELSVGEDPVILSEKIRYEHMQVLGSSGTGKTYIVIKGGRK